MSFRFIFLNVIIFLCFFYTCSKQETTPLKSSNKTDSTPTFNLTDKQKKVLEGAKKCLEIKFDYDINMAYHLLKYKDGKNIGSQVYPNGDIDPTLGVCTEVTIRSLRWGGVCDLQEEIHNDIKANWNDYPMNRWDAKKPDVNIDHRRVPNQLVWFKKNWKEITDNKYEPGDIVVWDMNEDSWADHIGIISDKFINNIPDVIHNFPSPGYVAEENVFNRWKILGVFRVK